jgi:hypothetical protein
MGSEKMIINQPLERRKILGEELEGAPQFATAQDLKVFG